MGFWDFLSGKNGKGFDVKELSYGELEGWLLSRQDSESKKIMQEARSILREIEGLAGEIRASVKHLDSLHMPENMYERAEKIIRTSKPDYVKAMLDELDGLSFSCVKTFGGMKDFSAKLEDAVNSLGKIDATRGRYLSFGFEEQHRNIQRKGKKLLELQKRLKDILGSNKTLERIGLIIAENDNLKELTARKNSLSREKGELKAALEAARKKLDDVTIMHKKESSKTEYSRIEELKVLLDETKERRKSLEDRIFHSLSPIRKDLMKYRRQVFDEPGKDKCSILDRLTQDSVQVLFETDSCSLRDVLSDFKKAVEEGKLEVKDREKTLLKTRRALDELEKDPKSEHAKLLTEERWIVEELESLSEADARHKIRDELKSIEHRVTEYEVKIRETDERIKNYEAQLKERKTSISEMLDNLTEGKVKLR